MARYPAARWRGPIPNQRVGAIDRPTRGLILHVIEGSLSAADSVFHDPGWKASAHFGIGNDGTVWQWVDTDDEAWAQAAGNPQYLSVETEGWDTMPLTVAQVGAMAALYAWGRRLYGWPYVLAETPGQAGLGWHGMGGQAWGGHLGCPGQKRRDQRAEILALAQQGPAPAPPFPPPWKVVPIGAAGHLVYR